MQEGIEQQQRTVDDEPPKAKASKGKRFGDTGLPFSQIDTIDSENPEKHGQNHRDQAIFSGSRIVQTSLIFTAFTSLSSNYTSGPSMPT